MPSLAEGVDDHVACEPQPPAEGDDDRSVGESVLEPCHATVARQHERPAAEHRMVGVDVAPPAQDRDLGRRGQVEARAELGVRVRGRRIDLVCAPHARRRCSKNPGTDEHDIGQRP